MNLLETTPGPRNLTKSVLDFLQTQLESAEIEPLVDVVGGLAKAFGADGAGLGVLLEEPVPTQPAVHVSLAMAEAVWEAALPEVLPWEKDDLLLGRVKQAGDVFAVQTNDGNHWLLAPIRQEATTWLLWLMKREPPSWGPADRSCLTLAGTFLVQRFLASSQGLHWLTRKCRLHLQDGINRSAAVTRRLAHDFCNILTSISGFAELALLNMPADSAAHRFAGEVLESARQGARWSHKLQVFSLNRQQRFLPVSLSALLSQEQARPDWHRGIGLKVDVPPQLPSVAVEVESLRLALNAILDNAREAITGQGIVSIAARPTNLSASGCLELLGRPRPGQHVELTVTDSGAGLTVEVQEKLFREMFFTGKGRRRGLGLALVYGIMQCYQGGFRLDPAHGNGTTVKMLLPVSEEPNAGTNPRPAVSAYVDDGRL